MSRLTMIVGVALILLGLAGYVTTGGVSITALIPLAFGVVYLALGYLGEHREVWRKHLMHVAAVLSLLGIFGNMGAIVRFPMLLIGESLPNMAAVVARFMMALICAVQLIAAIRSFVIARLLPQRSR